MSAHTSPSTPKLTPEQVRAQLLGTALMGTLEPEMTQKEQDSDEKFSFSWFFLVFWLTLIATLLFSWYTTQGI